VVIAFESYLWYYIVMETVIAPGLALEADPFVLGHPESKIVNSLIYYLDEMAEAQKAIVDEHCENPIDVIIGDDVSGRIPTLITHRFLRLAHAAGHIDTVPHTMFMASGNVMQFSDPDGAEQAWRKNLTAYAGLILGQIAAKNVKVITDLVVTGDSVDRLKTAFSAQGVEASHRAILTGLYLRGYKQDRRLVGVKKHGQDPVVRFIQIFSTKAYMARSHQPLIGHPFTMCPGSCNPRGQSAVV
jgi:hypothetical protein